MEAYEQTLKSMVEQQERFAQQTPVEWGRSMLEAQAEFTREIAKFYESAAKEASRK